MRGFFVSGKASLAKEREKPRASREERISATATITADGISIKELKTMIKDEENEN